MAGERCSLNLTVRRVATNQGSGTGYRASLRQRNLTRLSTGRCLPQREPPEGPVCDARATFSGKASVGVAGLFQKLEELHWCSVDQDERYKDAFGWAVRRYQHLLPNEGALEIVDFECNVRNRLHYLRQRAFRLETHPLNAERIPFVIRAEQPVGFKVCLPGLLHPRRNPEVMVPAQSTTSSTSPRRSTAGHRMRRSVYRHPPIFPRFPRHGCSTPHVLRSQRNNARRRTEHATNKSGCARRAARI